MSNFLKTIRQMIAKIASRYTVLGEKITKQQSHMQFITALFGIDTEIQLDRRWTFEEYQAVTDPAGPA
ncbi:hypothetical protein CVT25_004353 [Psilocybe cyanescens]|uniref:Uncharacterized protein n=1 Tax=Psilocybe cyanescens TaxID=93625 RepID=A0A409XPY5_PSICY|nr:hypothetical protein CVT25_004353 [Psilocybe cyanescens]